MNKFAKVVLNFALIGIVTAGIVIGNKIAFQFENEINTLLAPPIVDEETVEMLEDIISTAIFQASDKASAEMEKKMKEATGGINIPGLNL